MEWPRVPLEDVALVNPKDNDFRDLPDDTLVSFVPMRAVSEETATIIDQSVRPLVEVRRGYTVFKDRDVLFAKITPCMENGKCAIATGLKNGLGFGSTEFHILRTGPRLLAAFLHYFVRSKSFRAAAKQNMRGGAGQQRVPDDFVRKEPIPLPPLSEQRHIVEILNQADRLRRLRAEADAKADRILPALFIKMFGDPATNPMGWPRPKLGELLSTIDGGWSPVCNNRQATLGEWGVLKLGAVTWNRYIETEHKAFPNVLEPRPELAVCCGDVLFTRKNTLALVGACAYVAKTRPRLMLSDLIFRLRLRADANMHPIFLWAFLTCPSVRQSIQMLASGSAGSMPNISKSRLKVLQIERPPYGLQQRFAEAATRVNLLRDQTLLASEKAEQLYLLLMRQAFVGALTASWPGCWETAHDG